MKAVVWEKTQGGGIWIQSYAELSTYVVEWRAAQQSKVEVKPYMLETKFAQKFGLSSEISSIQVGEVASKWSILWIHIPPLAAVSDNRLHNYEDGDLTFALRGGLWIVLCAPSRSDTPRSSSWYRWKAEIELLKFLKISNEKYFFIIEKF